MVDGHVDDRHARRLVRPQQADRLVLRGAVTEGSTGSAAGTAPGEKMVARRVGLILAGLLVAENSNADGAWRLIAETTGAANSPVFSYALKEGSCNRKVNSSGIDTIVCLERITNGRTKISMFDWVGVQVTECRQGFGTIWTMDFDGNVLGKTQVGSGGGTIGSDEFDFLCAVATGVIT
jgi:hypothetical protein